jgi:hypothetical protein
VAVLRELLLIPRAEGAPSATTPSPKQQEATAPSQQEETPRPHLRPSLRPIKPRPRRRPASKATLDQKATCAGSAHDRRTCNLIVHWAVFRLLSTSTQAAQRAARSTIPMGSRRLTKLCRSALGCALLISAMADRSSFASTIEFHERLNSRSTFHAGVPESSEWPA